MNMLSLAENLVAMHDLALYAHLVRHKITAQVRFHPSALSLPLPLAVHLPLDPSWPLGHACRSAAPSALSRPPLLSSTRQTQESQLAAIHLAHFGRVG